MVMKSDYVQLLQGNYMYDHARDLTSQANSANIIDEFYM